MTSYQYDRNIKSFSRNTKSRGDVSSVNKTIDWGSHERIESEQVDKSSRKDCYSLSGSLLTPRHFSTSRSARVPVAYHDDTKDDPKKQSSPSTTLSTAKPKQQKKVDPFGSARPREDILKELGVNSCAMDERVEKRVAGEEKHIFIHEPDTPAGIDSSHEKDKVKTSFASKVATALKTSAKPKKKSPNPFGEAKPREEVLASKGIDAWYVDRRIENKAAATHLTPEQEADVERLRLELSKAEEEYWDANEHEMPEEKFRVVCEEKRRELSKRIKAFTEINMQRQQMQELHSLPTGNHSEHTSGAQERSRYYNNRRQYNYCDGSTQRKCSAGHRQENEAQGHFRGGRGSRGRQSHRYYH